MVLLLLLVSVVAIGCSKEAEPKKNSSATGLLVDVKAKGELVVGTEGTYAPFTFHDSTGKLAGFDVEIAEEVAKRLGVKATFVEAPWDALFAGLDSKRTDVIFNEVGIKPERQEKYDFSDGYIVSRAVVVTKKGNTEVKTFEDLKGKKSAQSLTSNYGKMAKSYGAEIVAVDSFNIGMDLLISGRVDTLLNDKLSILDYLKQKPDAPIQIVATAKDGQPSAAMFRKDGGEIVTEVNKALKAMKDDGTYLKISEKWFGEDVSK